jgi:hypothetical protein
MPTRRKGRRTSQTSGKRMSAARARGQQKKARRQKSRRLSIVFFSPLKITLACEKSSLGG